MKTNQEITVKLFGDKETISLNDYFDWQLSLRKALMHFEFHQNIVEVAHGTE